MQRTHHPQIHINNHYAIAAHVSTDLKATVQIYQQFPREYLNTAAAGFLTSHRATTSNGGTRKYQYYMLTFEKLQ